MPALEIAESPHLSAIEVNAEGFLVDGSQWTPEIAEEIAGQAGAREGQSPGLRRIAKNSGVGMKELYELFPKGPGKLAARVAGLPKPQSCV